jgi:hypothetical protein
LKTADLARYAQAPIPSLLPGSERPERALRSIG